MRVEITFQPEEADAVVQEFGNGKVNHVVMLPYPAYWLHMSQATQQTARLQHIFAEPRSGEESIMRPTSSPSPPVRNRLLTREAAPRGRAGLRNAPRPGHPPKLSPAALGCVQGA